MEKFLRVLETVIFCEFFNFGFVAPLHSERKSGTSDVRPGRWQRATV